MKLNVVPSPHIKTTDSVPRIMFDVILALIPALVAAVYFFGVRALVLALIGIFGGELLEIIIMRYIRGIKDFKPDGSAAVTGLLLAMNVNVGLPIWVFTTGLIAALVLGKHVYGGIGKNPFNPALVGRVFLLVSFPSYMTTWWAPKYWKLEALTTATPLGLLKEKGMEAVGFSYSQLFLGNTGGCLGEVSALALIIGFLYLVFRKRIKILIPVSYLGVVLILSSIFWMVNPERFGTPLLHLLSGGLMLGALFMATDMVTTPMTPKGHLIFGAGCGVITMIIRYFAGYPEGVSFSILIMNSLTPLIDMYTRPKIFGKSMGVSGQ
ncbi:MAG: H+/Na+-translocating ferredoxin:NAD+ oxidoreductase subunit [Thermotogota bacterium]|nr:H+/Na+-translocating ferredoxin:NAD+ oxidoreductase subunit [Thermotogota bacterium]HCZ06131.1 electron transporter RnfD [Thermotogota bacterium]